MLTFEQCQKHDQYYQIKESTIQSINDYVEHKLEPGSFVTAVLANDLKGSFGRADHENLGAMFQICCYVYNEIPASCQGSYEKVRAWFGIENED